ncbi:MAG: multidrug efflux RND transporter permease subunit [Holophagales bacterium]|nr:multidrug efflux RND transporter permease subunit [Holophagales bacterium]
MSRFFIRRPIFATVIALVITLAGSLALVSLPIAQYPQITPPTVRVAAFYPGADAEVVAESVGAPLEEEVNGVEGMIYMSSTSANDGSYSLTVSFEVGTDPELAAIRVQNRVARAEASLPTEVVAQGVTTIKQSPTILLVANVYSPDESLDSLFLSNYASLRIVDELERVDGVGDVTLAGAGTYAMRVWLDPGLMSSRGLTAGDVRAALAEQNVQVAAGALGQPPAPMGIERQLSMTALGRLDEPEQFEEIVIRTAADGGLVRLGDVGRVELGARSYTTLSRLDGVPATSLLVYQLPGSNALDVRDRVVDRLEELSTSFPEGLASSIAYDTTLFVEAAISEVVKTLLIAATLVFLTILVFLQDLRATLVPAVAIPVSLVGTFTVMAGLGFSINLLTLFGLVLAIGIVVDDAIIVVENVKRKLSEGAESPRKAAEEAMDEVSGPIVATTLVLLAVFVPVAFMGGIRGALYEQFALTIAVSTVFSSVVALSLSPALSALFLRPDTGAKGPFGRAFDAFYQPLARMYLRIVGLLARRLLILAVLFVMLLGGAWLSLERLPTSFLPQEDQGVVIVAGQLPPAASLERTEALSRRVSELASSIPGVERSVEIVGLSLLDEATTSNAFTIFLPLDPWATRLPEGQTADAIVGQLFGGFMDMPEGLVFAFTPPPIQGLGFTSGFTLELQDRADLGPAELGRAVDVLVAASAERPELRSLRATYQANVPRIFADVDREKVKQLELDLGSVFGALQTYLGSSYVNDFELFGRTYPVYVQAEAGARMLPEDVGRLEVRASDGTLVPLASLARLEEIVGPQIVKRFNQFPSTQISGEAAPGYSSGESMAAIAELIDGRLGQGFGRAWSGTSYQEQRTTGAIGATLALAVVFVFLVLAAQYESWAAPLAVILAVPFGVLGASVGLTLRGMSNDVYAQIGLVLLTALASKNAILIVELAGELRRRGHGALDAALEAARLRLRPILMTSLAFVLGMAPLLVATGAGAASRQSLGTTVFSGMLAATFLTAAFVPAFSRIAFRRAPTDAGKGIENGRTGSDTAEPTRAAADGRQPGEDRPRPDEDPASADRRREISQGEELSGEEDRSPASRREPRPRGSDPEAES